MKILKTANKLFNFYSRFSNKYSTAALYKINLTLNNVPLNSYLDKIKKDYKDFISNTENAAVKSKWVAYQPIIALLNERAQIEENLKNLSELLNGNDEEIKKLAVEEKEEFENSIKSLDDKLIDALLSIDNDDNIEDIVLEVNTGVGGQEAMLFAKEVFEMYCNFCSFKGWTFDIAEFEETDMGGIRHGSLLINGKNSFRYFKHEAGVHRVQRIPVTEKGGRIHTSTISVLALPQPTDIQVNLQQKDLKIETKRATGAGGQHVNTTDSAVRITHLPSGISVECQVDRSQIKNRKLALARLKALLYQKEMDQQTAEVEAARKSQVKSNFRNEKIRTYNFSQDRITDHRLQSCHYHNLKVFFEGGEQLEELIMKLDHQNRVENLLEAVKSVNK